jgi:hypothetical protein
MIFILSGILLVLVVIDVAMGKSKAAPSLVARATVLVLVLSLLVIVFYDKYGRIISDGLALNCCIAILDVIFLIQIIDALRRRGDR